MRNALCIWFGKLLSRLLRLAGRHGSALPGYIIERIHPGFLPSMLAKLPEGVVIVTGTNGKTTTTKMIAQLLSAQGKAVLTNKSGGNFVRGVISSIVQAAKPSGRLPYDVAVFEQDEAYAVKFARIYAPTTVVALNVTRDQLDRFGEIDTTAALLQEVVINAKKLVVLNDDDNRLKKLSVPSAATAVYFGIAERLQSEFPNDEQLYSAKKAAAKNHNRSVELINISEEKVSYKLDGQIKDVKLKIDGPHNALNGAAALATVKALEPEVDNDSWLNALSHIKAAFGRGELIDYHGYKLILQLVKNPASFGQALHVLDIHRPSAVAIVINDDYADGRDVSWLWDVDFKSLKNMRVITSGSRSFDMANRLKYDEIEAQALGPRASEMLEQLDGQTAVIFATYTAMLAVRRTIGRSTKLERV